MQRIVLMSASLQRAELERHLSWGMAETRRWVVFCGERRVRDRTFWSLSVWV